MTTAFKLTDKQREVNKAVLASPATHALLYGGSRSGKTFLICRAVVIRALRAKSTHAVLREHFNHLKHSIIYDTMDKVLHLCFPDLAPAMRLDRSDWFHELPNGSRIIYGGLDDHERTEKVLGQEHSTVFLNECSQISYSARNMALTRLAQSSGLRLRVYYDCNPPREGHWVHRVFVKGVEPESGEPLEEHGTRYAAAQVNPVDNLDNLPDSVMETLRALPARDRQRFLEGRFGSQVENALWAPESFRHLPAPQTEDARDELLARLTRVVVAVDASGTSGPEDTTSDAVGLVVVGRDAEGQGYVLADETGHYTPEAWGRKTVALYHAWRADRIVAERNYGGDMIRAVIHLASGQGVPVQLVTASRGKHLRAEPVSALYEAGNVWHVGRFPDLEDEFCQFSTAGYEGERSPNRADAAVFGLTDLLVDTRPSWRPI